MSSKHEAMKSIFEYIVLPMLISYEEKIPHLVGAQLLSIMSVIQDGQSTV